LRGSQLDDAAGKTLPRRLSAEPGVHGRADVRELALLVDAAGCVAPGRVGEEESVLARVGGRLGRRVAAVVGRDGGGSAPLQRLEDVGQASVEILQTTVEVDRVVAVAPEHVR